MAIDRSGSAAYTLVTSSTRPGSPTNGTLIYETDTNLFYVSNGANWICITPQSATVATSQTTTSTAYADLATSGPAVTVLTGTRAVVTVGAQLGGTIIAISYRISPAVSGATTSAASDNNAANYVAYTANVFGQQSYTSYFTSLTPGSNTFTARYRVSAAATGTFVNRVITVLGIP